VNFSGSICPAASSVFSRSLQTANISNAQKFPSTQARVTPPLHRDLASKVLSKSSFTLSFNICSNAGSDANGLEVELLYILLHIVKYLHWISRAALFSATIAFG